MLQSTDFDEFLIELRGGGNSSAALLQHPSSPDRAVKGMTWAKKKTNLGGGEILTPIKKEFPSPSPTKTLLHDDVAIEDVIIHSPRTQMNQALAAWKAIVDGLGLLELGITYHNFSRDGKELSLAESSLGSRYGEALALLMSSKGLIGVNKLDLSNNRIDQKSAACIIQGLRGISYLNLDHNRIGRKGAIALERCISSGSTSSSGVGANQVGMISDFQIDLRTSIINLNHAITASKTGVLTGLIVVVMTLIKWQFKFKLPLFVFIGCFIGDLITHPTHFGHWWTEAFITALVAGGFSYFVTLTPAGQKLESYFK